jgi:hypothetical protein
MAFDFVKLVTPPTLKVASCGVLEMVSRAEKLVYVHFFGRVHIVKGVVNFLITS